MSYEGIEARMSTALGDAPKSQCRTCKHLDRSPGKGTSCAAFPNQIPTDILLGYYDHTVPYIASDFDDGGVRYERI